MRRRRPSSRREQSALAPDAGRTAVWRSPTPRQLALDLDGALGGRRRRRRVWRPSAGAAPGAAGRALSDAGRPAPGRAQAADEAARPGRRTPLTDIAQGYRRSRRPTALAAAEAAFRRALQQREPESRPRCSAWASPRSGAAISRQARCSCRTRPRADPASSLLRSYLGKAYFTGRDGAGGGEAVCHRQGAGPDRPHALVLRRDPAAARQPAGGGAALDRPVDRAQRQPGAVPLAAAARPGPGHARRQSRPDLPGPGLHPARHQRGPPRADARSGQQLRASFPVRRLSGRAEARGGAGERAAAVAAPAAGGPQPGPAEPGLRRSQRDRQCRTGTRQASTSSRRCSKRTDGRSTAPASSGRRTRSATSSRRRHSGVEPRSASASTISTPTASGQRSPAAQDLYRIRSGPGDRQSEPSGRVPAA